MTCVELECSWTIAEYGVGLFKMKGLRFPTGFTVLHLVKAKRPKHAGASSSGKLPEIQLIQDVELAISFGGGGKRGKSWKIKLMSR